MKITLEIVLKVISRPIKKDLQNLDLKETFKIFSEKYKNTLCYLLISEDEIWMVLNS